MWLRVESFPIDTHNGMCVCPLADNAHTTQAPPLESRFHTIGYLSRSSNASLSLSHSFTTGTCAHQITSIIIITVTVTSCVR